jgi:hypothetical protein
VDKNSTVIFPAPLMSTIQELGAFLSRETQAAGELPVPAPVEELPVPESIGELPVAGALGELPVPPGVPASANGAPVIP